MTTAGAAAKLSPAWQGVNNERQQQAGPTDHVGCLISDGANPLLMFAGCVSQHH